MSYSKVSRDLVLDNLTLSNCIGYYDDEVVVETNMIVDGNLTVNGNISPETGSLIVNGNLLVEGSITGNSLIGKNGQEFDISVSGITSGNGIVMKENGTAFLESQIHTNGSVVFPTNMVVDGILTVNSNMENIVCNGPVLIVGTGTPFTETNNTGLEIQSTDKAILLGRNSGTVRVNMFENNPANVWDWFCGTTNSTNNTLSIGGSTGGIYTGATSIDFYAAATVGIAHGTKVASFNSTGLILLSGFSLTLPQSTFSLTLNGSCLSGPVSGTVTYQKSGSLVTLSFPASFFNTASGSASVITSTSTLPVAILPTTGFVSSPIYVLNGTSIVAGVMVITASGSMIFGATPNEGNFGTTGSVGLQNGGYQTASYLLN